MNLTEHELSYYVACALLDKPIESERPRKSKIKTSKRR